MLIICYSIVLCLNLSGVLWQCVLGHLQFLIVRLNIGSGSNRSYLVVNMCSCHDWLLSVGAYGKQEIEWFLNIR